jgi:hypothetical protein
VIGREFTDWQAPKHPDHASCSPNLRALLDELRRRWPFFVNDGCFGARPIRGSQVVPSSHTYGAAIDVAYPSDVDDVVAREVAPWLVARSFETNVDAIHDYRRCRIWRAGRTALESDACSSWWKAQRPSPVTGMGQPWAHHLHQEVTAAGWADATPMLSRWTE